MNPLWEQTNKQTTGSNKGAIKLKPSKLQLSDNVKQTSRGNILKEVVQSTQSITKLLLTATAVQINPEFAADIIFDAGVFFIVESVQGPTDNCVHLNDKNPHKNQVKEAQTGAGGNKRSHLCTGDICSQELGVLQQLTDLRPRSFSVRQPCCCVTNCMKKK